jgi:putative transposase
MRSNLFWLNDQQWQKMEPFLPTDVRGVARVDDRRVISGILHVMKSGCRWCDCPPEYGPPTTIYNRFVRWAERGVWYKLLRGLAGRGRSAETQMIDSTHVKAHRSASGGRGTSKNKRLDARAAGAIRRYTLLIQRFEVTGQTLQVSCYSIQCSSVCDGESIHARERVIAWPSCRG